MKRIIFIWNYPFLNGVPLEALILKKKVDQYCVLLNQYFDDNKMEWHISADSTYGDIDRLLQDKYDVYVFIPGGETRYWLYDNLFKEEKAARYYLTQVEFYQKDILKIVNYIKEIGNK